MRQTIQTDFALRALETDSPMFADGNDVPGSLRRLGAE